jgi:hypothetical protein
MTGLTYFGLMDICKPKAGSPSWSRWNQDKLLNYKGRVGMDEKQNY